MHAWCNSCETQQNCTLCPIATDMFLRHADEQRAELERPELRATREDLAAKFRR